jgi:hypothetical protein
MVLIGVRGKHANRELLLQSFTKVPSLFIDCEDCANPHILFPQISVEELNNVFVLYAESLYRFRSVLKKTPAFAKQLGIKGITITTFRHLFSYDDEIENINVYEQCWQIIKAISCDYEVIVGVSPEQEKFAEKYCDEIINCLSQEAL